MLRTGTPAARGAGDVPSDLLRIRSEISGQLDGLEKGALERVDNLLNELPTDDQRLFVLKEELIGIAKQQAEEIDRIVGGATLGEGTRRR